MNIIDVQVNGYAGVLFWRDGLTMEQMQFAAQRLRDSGTRAILPAIITDSTERTSNVLRRLRKLIDQDPALRKMMPAFHIEGPCISGEEGYRGAHPAEHCCDATRDVIEPLIDAAGGFDRVAIITLAPERDKNMAVTRWLSENGVIVSAGHTNASLEVLREAEQAGLAMYTHLGNGSKQLMDRHDNIIYRAMSLEKIKYSIVPDGHHIPFWVARQWIKWLGVERCIFTTDCVEAADAPPGSELMPNVELDTSTDTPVVRLKGTPYLAGSALTPKQGYQNAMKHLGLTEAQAKAMWCDQPAALIAKWLK